MKMEFKMTAVNKAFIIITILGPFLLFGVSILPSLITRNSAQVDEGTVVGLVGASERLIENLDISLEQSPISIVRGRDEESMIQAVTDKEIAAYVVIPENYLEAQALDYYSLSGTDFVLKDTMGYYLGSVIVSERLRNEGLDAERISYLSARPQMNGQSLAAASGKSGGPQNDEFSIIMTGIAFTMLLYMTILLHGQSAARSVLKEKTSKTVEIMLSSVRPSEMLFGKIFGQAAAGILQYAIWVSVAMLLIKVIGPAANLTLPISLTVSTLAYLVLFFILAFFIYSSAYAAIGSAAEDETHLGQLSWPVLIFLIIPMVTVSSIIVNPGAPFAVFLSLFPLTSPITMFLRILMGSPEAWEVLLCIGILLVTITVIIALASKVFRVGILMTGKRYKISEVVKWVRYKSI
jgi:ABC-2 type transport system permease protein